MKNEIVLTKKLYMNRKFVFTIFFVFLFSCRRSSNDLDNLYEHWKGMDSVSYPLGKFKVQIAATRIVSNGKPVSLLITGSVPRWEDEIARQFVQDMISEQIKKGYKLDRVTDSGTFYTRQHYYMKYKELNGILFNPENYTFQFEFVDTIRAASGSITRGAILN